MVKPVNVLFLDLDGPVFPDRYIRCCPEQSAIPQSLKNIEGITYWKMDPMSVSMLNRLYDIHKFKTVISSTWRRFVNKEQMQALFAENDLELQLHDEWMTPISSYHCRHGEIKTWLDMNEVNDYMAIDDNESGHHLDIIMPADKIVMVNIEFGISIDNFMKMLRIVSKWEGIEPKKIVRNLW